MKDLEDVAGLPTTFGSLAFADNVARRDSVQVSRLRAAGAIVVGKTNTPEFAANRDRMTALVAELRGQLVPIVRAITSRPLADAGGVVIEEGGLLSHGAVVAREYGIPAVLRIEGATKILRTGQRLRIDGGVGTVEIL